jgi:hypothetical protein
MRIMSDAEVFPRSFDICFGADDQVLMPVRDAAWLRAGQEMTFGFREVRTRQLKIRQVGPDLPNCGWFKIGEIEFLSPDPHFAPGIFRTLFNEHRRDIRQFLEIRSRHLCLDELHNPNAQGYILTYGAPNQWVQIEIVDGKLITNCYRLKRTRNDKLRSWSLLGSNEASLPLAEWTELDRRSEARPGDFNDFATFPAVGGPFCYFRIVSTGPNWSDSANLLLFHIDLYGVLITE